MPPYRLIRGFFKTLLHKYTPPFAVNADLGVFHAVNFQFLTFILFSS